MLLISVLTINACTTPSTNSQKTALDNNRIETKAIEKPMPEKETPNNELTDKTETKPKKEEKNTTPKKKRAANKKKAIETFKGFSNFYKQFEKPAQTFTLNTTKDTIITCAEGTKITIKPNLFITESGKEVTGNVQLKVKEFYKTSDILLANLSTASNGKLLETGGMLHIEAYSGSEKCQLKHGKNIELSFPTNNFKKGMQLFRGTWQDDNIDWQLNDDFPSESEEIEVFDTPILFPEFPGGYAKLQEYIANIKYPTEAKEAGFEGSVYTRFTVTTTGAIENIEIAYGVPPSIKNELIRVIESMPNWIPAKRGNIVVAEQTILPLVFRLDDGIKRKDNLPTYRKFLSEDIEKQIEQNDISNAKMDVVSNYLLSSSKLGWINCDRFLRENIPLTNYFVDGQTTKNIDVKIIFNDIKSVLAGRSVNQQFSFPNTPIGHKVTIVALKYENNQYHLATKQTSISNTTETNLVFKPVNAQQLKTEMKRFDNI